MKTKMLSLASMFLLGTMTVFGQAKTEKIEVKGNCSMCERRIEKAANTVEGVTDAQWNKKTKVLAFTFNSNKGKVDQVHKAVAKAGHDTDKVKASKETYDKLPNCCQYDRTEAKKGSETKGHKEHKGHEGHQM
ncbi:Copper chaperone CopZ [Saccharicrinis carchari]|uniref:Copper chaperone CopZ n=1 Tax=Saccharicrinis carchari TaxID=1168039 RepID=A0A521AP99_SACCC|nr:cation transporter [Saccharicrinis carchari]SMO36663.1 Copper chaperone CopZ [Saccharicrinis carchari]